MLNSKKAKQKESEDKEMNYEEITYEKCKYCGKPIWNNNRNGYHRKCLIDIEFDENENEAYMENPKKTLRYHS